MLGSLHSAGITEHTRPCRKLSKVRNAENAWLLTDDQEIYSLKAERPAAICSPASSPEEFYITDDLEAARQGVSSMRSTR